MLISVNRRGKIVCTLGPATATDETLTALVEAGMDVARLNFSHGDYADHEANYKRVRAASDLTRIGPPPDERTLLTTPADVSA